MNIRMLLLIFISLLFSSNCLSDDGSIGVKIIPIAKSLQLGVGGEFILVLPASDENRINWEFYVGSLQPELKGKLNLAPQLKKVTVDELKLGKFTASIIIYNKDGVPVEMNVSSIEVHPDKKHAPLLSYLATFISAILIFYLTSKIKKQLERSTEQGYFEGELKQRITEMINITHQNDKFSFLTWVQLPTNAPIILSYRKQAGLRELIRLAKKLEEGLINVDLFHDELRKNNIVQEMKNLA